jgi:NADH:ubiquinone oxidoreductase subunit D
MLAEISRINYKPYRLAILGIFMGHSTMFMWTTADRELFVELADMSSGQRIMHAYLVPGEYEMIYLKNLLTRHSSSKIIRYFAREAKK